MEAAFLGGVHARIEPLFSAVDTDLVRLFAAIDRALRLRIEKNGADDETTAPCSPVDREELTGLICQAITQLEQFDSSVEETVARIRRMVGGDAPMRAIMVSIGQHLSGYNYERGLAELTACAKTLGIMYDE